MKRLTDLFIKGIKRPDPAKGASISNHISTCQMHDNSKLPNLKALEMCSSCNTGMCYVCANDHAEANHTIDWGFDIFNDMEAPRNEANEKFNQGYRTTVDLMKLKCPCGNNIPGIQTSTICAACGTATCSAECHDKFVQSKNKCLFIRNFIKNEQTSGIQGLRSIMWINQYAMVRDGHPAGTAFTRTSPKFMMAALGELSHTIFLQRGYRQYGQPLQSTLDAIVDINVSDDCEHFQSHKDKLCGCTCDHCASVSPHSVHNCFYKCKDRLVFDDKTLKKLGLYKDCHCQCFDCIRMPGHLKCDCFEFCQTSPYTK